MPACGAIRHHNPHSLEVGMNCFLPLLLPCSFTIEALCNDHATAFYLAGWNKMKMESLSCHTKARDVNDRFGCLLSVCNTNDVHKEFTARANSPFSHPSLPHVNKLPL